MPIPDFQTLMLPVLRCAADGSAHAVRDIVDDSAGQFDLSPEERDQLVPSGQQRTFANRVSWSVSYLKRAALLKGAGKGKFEITNGITRCSASTRPSSKRPKRATRHASCHNSLIASANTRRGITR
jgi:restriction endonuclease Mrr